VPDGRDCKAFFGQQELDVGLLPGPDLDHQMPADQAPCVGGDRPVGGKAVRPAVECEARVVVAHVARKGGDVGRRDVGRVGHHEIEPAAEE